MMEFREGYTKYVTLVYQLFAIKVTWTTDTSSTHWLSLVLESET